MHSIVAIRLLEEFPAIFMCYIHLLWGFENKSEYEERCQQVCELFHGVIFEGTRSSSSGQEGIVAYEEFTFKLPRFTKVKSAKWPCKIFMRNTGIKEEFKIFAANIGLMDFLAIPYPAYENLSNHFVQ